MGNASHLLTKTVAFQAPTGVRTVHGDPQYGPVQSIPCRYTRQREESRTPEGIIATESTIIVTEVEIPEGSLIWLDGIGAGDRKQARIPQGRTFANDPYTNYVLYETRL